MKSLLLVLALVGCAPSALTCPDGDVELRSRAPAIDTMHDATAAKPSQQIECVSA